jgi:hypothetical protein
MIAINTQGELGGIFWTNNNNKNKNRNNNAGWQR